MSDTDGVVVQAAPEIDDGDGNGGSSTSSSSSSDGGSSTTADTSGKDVGCNNNISVDCSNATAGTGVGGNISMTGDGSAADDGTAGAGDSVAAGAGDSVAAGAGDGGNDNDTVDDDSDNSGDDGDNSGDGADIDNDSDTSGDGADIDNDSDTSGDDGDDGPGVTVASTRSKRKLPAVAVLLVDEYYDDSDGEVHWLGDMPICGGPVEVQDSAKRPCRC